METDFLEQLAEVDVPPVPAEFDREVHHRVNDRLLVVHVAEFVLQAIPYAFLQFVAGVVGFAVLTLSGDARAGTKGAPGEPP